MVYSRYRRPLGEVRSQPIREPWDLFPTASKCIFMIKLEHLKMFSFLFIFLNRGNKEKGPTRKGVCPRENRNVPVTTLKATGFGQHWVTRLTWLELVLPTCTGSRGSEVGREHGTKQPQVSALCTEQSHILMRRVCPVMSGSMGPLRVNEKSLLTCTV